MNVVTSRNEEEMQAFRKWLKEHLRAGSVTVTFLKKNGEERKMLCTLQEGIAVPADKKTDRVKIVNEEVCPVFDLDKHEWRSFRYDAIISVEISI